MEEAIKTCLPMYTIGEVIGDGIYGRVYRVFDAMKERAVKVVPLMVERSLAANSAADLDSRMNRDYHAVKDYYQDIKGPGVVEIYDFHLVGKPATASKAEGHLVILMQLCPANLLNHVLDHYPLAPHVAIGLMQSLAEVLQRLAARAGDAILLTDLKPSNLLLDDQQNLLVGDLGGLKRLGSASTSASPQFTPNWTSPEFILQGAVPSVPSVIFSYGMVSYYIWEGKLPYADENFVERLRLMKTRGIPFDRDDLPDHIRELLNACLADEPGKRPGSFEDILDALLDPDIRLKRPDGRTPVTRPNRRLPEATADHAVSLPPLVETEPRGYAYRPGQLWREPVLGMEFVWIPDGHLQRPLDPAGRDDPAASDGASSVFIRGFWAGRYPVTQGQWRRIMPDNPSHFDRGDHFPVENVSWNDAVDFLRRLNSRHKNRYLFCLPTVAQWTYAAVAGETAFPAEADIDQVAWHRENSHLSTHPVGRKMPSPMGLFDLFGNVMEWAGDGSLEAIFHPQRRHASAYADVGVKRDGCGGGWNSPSWECHPGSRKQFAQRLGYANLGFRVVRLMDLPTPQPGDDDMR